MSAYDVIVAGGGAAGIGTAVGAAQAGAHTLLIERGSFSRRGRHFAKRHHLLRALPVRQRASPGSGRIRGR